MEPHGSVGSTNALALEYAKAGHPGRLWLVAEEQLSGRGRRGRPWVSPKGNLYATLLLVNEFSSEKAALLSFVAGVSLADTISELALEQGKDDLHIELKWPNDVLLNGAKASGILLEMAQLVDGGSALAIGIGLNVAYYPDNLPYAASSLHSVGVMVGINELFTKLSEKWAAYFSLWQQPGGEKYIREKWLANAANLGGPISFTQNDNTHFGVFETLDDEFQCILREETGARIVINAGDVHFGMVASEHKHH